MYSNSGMDHIPGGALTMSQTTVLILAAGAGTRMKSSMPKVLHQVAGISMIEHILDLCDDLNLSSPITVIGHEAEQMRSALKNRSTRFALQEQQLGTGHAVMVAQEQIPDQGNTLILYGDVPLLKKQTVAAFLKQHEDEENTATVMTTYMADPTGYGRIVRNGSGKVVQIVEQRDATEEQQIINEINTGIMCFNTKYLKIALKNLTNDNDQKEYYLTDAIELLEKSQLSVGAYAVADEREVMGINSRVQLHEAEQIYRESRLAELMESGVTIIDAGSTWIEKYVKVGRDTMLLPGCYLRGNTEIGEGCMIGPNAHISNSIISDNVQINNSTVVDSKVDTESTVGPYANLRPGSDLGRKVKIGDFVEVKNSRIDDGAKVSHLSYIGDGHVGKEVNIGCGVVFVNYDGVNKFRTEVGDNAFIGCNTNLVAPVTVGANAYVAAGSTITNDVPEDALGIARARQENKEGWVTRKRGKKE